MDVMQISKFSLPLSLATLWIESVRVLGKTKQDSPLEKNLQSNGADQCNNDEDSRDIRQSIKECSFSNLSQIVVKFMKFLFAIN